MPVTIIQGTNKKPVSSDELRKFFNNHNELNGQLFLGYPIIGTPEGRFSIDAMWISDSKGIVLFDLVEGKNIDGYQERQDEAANFLEAKLKTHRELSSRRNLLVPIQTITFAPAIAQLKEKAEKNYFFANSDSKLIEVIRCIDDWEGKENKIFEKTLSAIQSISTIRKSRIKREVQKPDSRGAKLKQIEDSIATLDVQQGGAVVETVEGVQRIRGLAGSGKTIVLALKAAYLHAQHPEWRIAVTFNTRSLKGQFQRLINTFCIEQTGEEPDWEHIRVINAWGSPGAESRDGLYHEFCRVHDISYYDFETARKFGRGKEFEGACQESLNSVKEATSRYDAILIDEAQDFPPIFLRLCYEFLTKEKRIVYAYDELQSLSGESLPSPEIIFGNKPDGQPRVQFGPIEPGKPKRDILLKKCYRNPRPVLVTAHALGFGIYREPQKKNDIGLIQMFDHPDLWEEVGYRIKEGELKEGCDVVLERTDETSPEFLENHSSMDDLIQFHKFNSEEEQAKRLVYEIEKNLTQDELRHDDIVVINPNPLTTRKKTGLIRKMLYEKQINSHLAGVDTDPDVFFQSSHKSVTFTGIFRAKGNEAGMVYVINTQDCQSSMYNLATIRNRLFTAISRSKAWVRVLGIGDAMERLIEEFNRVKDRNFELRFQYPTKDQREKLKIIHRDITEQERRRLDENNKSLAKVVNGLESGAMTIEDLDENMVRKLESFLQKKR